MESNIKAMKRIIKCVVTTADRGLLLKQNSVRNRGRDFIFEVTGMSNSDYAKDDLKKSVSGWFTFLNGAATSFIIELMPNIALSVMEDEIFQR